MEVYVKQNNELIPINSGINLFESINTHSGDVQSVELIAERKSSKAIKNLMTSLSIIDKDIEFLLKKDSNNSNEVFYIRTTTEKCIKFTLEIKDSNGTYSFIKPDSNGLFLINKNWENDEFINIKITATVEEGFSESFGEITSLGLRLSWYGEMNEKKSFA